MFFFELAVYFVVMIGHYMLIGTENPPKYNRISGCPDSSFCSHGLYKLNVTKSCAS